MKDLEMVAYLGINRMPNMNTNKAIAARILDMRADLKEVYEQARCCYSSTLQMYRCDADFCRCGKWEPKKPHG